MTKTSLFVICALIFAAFPTWAEDWTTTDGKIYKNVTVVSHDATAVTISSSDGVATLSIALLDKGLQKRVLDDNVTAKDWTVNGQDYHNVVVGQVEADRVHITYDGGVGAVSLADLPPDLQKRFSYDPKKAAAAMAIRTQQEAESDRMAQEAAKQAEIQKQQEEKRQELLKQAVTIRGTVIQILPEGMLVQCPTLEELMAANNAEMAGTMRSVGGGGTSIYDKPADGGPSVAERMGLLPDKGTKPVYGMCFLKNYPGQDQLVDNSRIRIVAYPDGPVSYQAVDGSTKTIPCYNASP